MKKQPYRNWVILRKITQFIFLIGFLFLFISTSTSWPSHLRSNLFFRIDPLISLSHSIANRKVLGELIAGFFILGTAFIVGRGWCGWICPLGTVLDYLSPKRDKKISRHQPINLPERLRRIKYFLLFLIITLALWRNLTLLILDPITILMRSLTTAIWPAFDQAIRVAEKALYRIPLLEDAVTQFDTWIRPSLFPSYIIYNYESVIFLIIFISIISLNCLAPRFWCRYLCPLGGLLGLPSKFSLLRRTVGPECKNCKLCSNTCPTGTIDASNGFKSDPSECTLCLDCLIACPSSTISFTPRIQSALWNSTYDPSRRQVLISLITATAATALFNRDWRQIHPLPYQLRPPGTDDQRLFSNCVRCGLCIRICPTGALSPAPLDFWVEGIWMPLFVPRLGYCDYACTACSEVCPTHAIPTLTLSEKRQQIIGKAYIDTDRCLAWADHTDCIVCEEMCPLPEKAIVLKNEMITIEDGSSRMLQLPFVERERCIGCGICENKCPLIGEAAIRVRSVV